MFNKLPFRTEAWWQISTYSGFSTDLTMSDAPGVRIHGAWSQNSRSRKGRIKSQAKQNKGTGDSTGFFALYSARP
jgi:hypothetical protein